jgi:hypothetical protein
MTELDDEIRDTKLGTYTVPPVDDDVFASITWPAWPNIVDDPNSRHNLMEVFQFGIPYVAHCLLIKPMREELGPNADAFVTKWNPKYDEAKFEEIVHGDQLLIASFHSGAIHAIEKLCQHETEDELLADGLARFAFALEFALHKQFVKRFVDLLSKVAQEAHTATEQSKDAKDQSKAKDEGRLDELQTEDGHED